MASSGLRCFKYEIFIFLNRKRLMPKIEYTSLIIFKSINYTTYSESHFPLHDWFRKWRIPFFNNERRRRCFTSPNETMLMIGQRYPSLIILTVIFHIIISLLMKHYQAKTFTRHQGQYQDKLY